MALERFVRRHRLVSRDVIDLAGYIGQDSTGAALRFFDNVDTTLLGLAEMPGKGALREFDDPRLAGLRSWAVDGFPNHLIFYQPTDFGIYVLSVRHGARELPGDLAERV
jgi:plasmid stabilization system protein ParE